MLYPVILSGGSGSRLWPLSRTLLPKQFLPLVSDKTMLQETVLRVGRNPDIERPIIVCNVEHRFLVAEQLRESNVSAHSIMLEPEGRNTAPAVAVAALAAVVKDPNAILLVLPADHLIADVKAFAADIERARSLAESGRLVTFGVRPDHPATGYGYIRRGVAHDAVAGSYKVAQFVEKPNASKAAEFVSSGEFYWNSGMFVLPARRYLEELENCRPDIFAASKESFERAARDLDFCRLDADAFKRCPSDSIDYAVMEKTSHASVVAASFDWNDIGSWSSLWETGAKDGAGNVKRGDVYLDGASDCYVRSESRLIAAVGVKDLVIVETDDAILVAHKDAAQNVKNTVESLKANKREEHIAHKRVYRPWGYYESIDDGARFQVKRIMVKPGHKLSLQMHHHRAEHWIVVSGTARVTRDKEEILLTENQSTYIPLGATHRLENPGKLPLHLIEVQSGSYLGEDDIVRFVDDYKRA
ncbi:MAG: mannose-1-phosphate guanylyltransferase/mannose-6-phosphate isomerase [Burkholderiales bacterium]